MRREVRIDTATKVQPCAACRRPIAPGDRIAYTATERRAVHFRCHVTERDREWNGRASGAASSEARPDEQLPLRGVS